MLISPATWPRVSRWNRHTGLGRSTQACLGRLQAQWAVPAVPAGGDSGSAAAAVAVFEANDVVFA